MAYPALYISAGFILGLLFGSFLNVVIIRLPRKMFYLWDQQCKEHLAADEETITQTNQAIDTPDHNETSESADDEQVVYEQRGGDVGSTEAFAEETSDEQAPPGIVFEPSHCVVCKHPLSAWENIPVISFLALRGRCRHCGTRISWRYPIVEFITACLTAIVLWQLGPTLTGLGAVLLTWSLIALSGIDFDHHLLPDDITLPLLWLGLAFNLAGTFTSLDSAVIGAISGYGILWGVFHAFRLLTGKHGMGYGDFKLTAALGAWLGWQMIPIIILAASLTGTIIGVALILLGQHQREKPLPFGPYLAMGGWIALLWGPWILDTYLASFPG